MGGHGGGGHGGGGHGGGGHHGGGGGFRGGRGGWGGGVIYGGWPLDFYDYDPYPAYIEDTTVIVLNPDGTPAQVASSVGAEHGHSASGAAARHAHGKRAPHPHHPHAPHAATHKPRPHARKSKLHGETASAGATGEDEPNYGAFGIDNDLATSTGGTDPFALATFGEDETAGTSGGSDAKGGSGPNDPGADLPDDLGLPPQDDFWPYAEQEITVEDFYFDPLVHAGRAGTSRAIDTVIGFENDYYDGTQGVAAIMGYEPGGPMALMGCETLSGKRGGMRG